MVVPSYSLGKTSIPTTLIAPSSSQTHIFNISQSDISNGKTYTTGTPGYYQVSRELTFAPNATDDVMINITSSDVSLDLGGFRIFSDKSSTGTICINVANNLTNINIFNGVINSMTGEGVNIGSGCRNVHIANVTIHNCDEGGIVAASSDHIYISSCVINNCSGTSTLGNAAALRLTSCKHVYASNCEFSLNTGNSIPSNGAIITSCSGCEFESCLASHNVGTNSYGFKLSGSSDCSFKNCGSSGLSASSGIATGFDLSSTSLANKFTNCSSNNHSATSGNCKGFSADETSLSNSFADCEASSNRGDTSVYGFHLKGNGCHLDNCKANNGTASGGNCTGFYFDGTAATNTAASNVSNNCTANLNSASAGNANGFLLDTALGNRFMNCIATGNTTSAQNKYAAGFNSSSGKGNLFEGCAANSQLCTHATGGTTAGTADHYAAGFLMQSGETRSRITGCTASANNGGSGHGVGFGIYFRGGGVLTSLTDTSGPTRMLVKDCKIEFNTSDGSSTNQSNKYGFFDEHRDTTSALINNVSIGHGRCVSTLNTSQDFVDPVGSTSLVNGMNYFFRATGSDENPANMIHETDIFNWTTLSTSVPGWMNVSIVVEQVTTIDGGVSI